MARHVDTAQRLHSKTWNWTQKAHIVVCLGSSAACRLSATGLISCNSNHAFWGWLIHSLDAISERLLCHGSTGSVGCDWLRWGIQLPRHTDQNRRIFKASWWTRNQSTVTHSLSPSGKRHPNTNGANLWLSGNYQYNVKQAWVEGVRVTCLLQMDVAGQLCLLSKCPLRREWFDWSLDTCESQVYEPEGLSCVI